MANIARELAELLASWQVPSAATAEATRGDSTATSLEFWHQQARAVQTVVEVERMALALAREGKETDFVLEILPELYRGVFAVPTPWGTTLAGTARDALDPATGRTLRASAQLFAEYDVPVDVRGISAIQTALRDIEQLILDASQNEIPRNTRIYLLGLIRDALDALDDPAFDGGRRARTATHAVNGALTAELARVPQVPAPAGAPEETKSFRQRLISQVNKIVTASVLAFGVTYATQAAESTWELTETAISQVYSELSEEARSAPPAPPELEPGSQRLQLESGSSDSAG